MEFTLWQRSIAFTLAVALHALLLVSFSSIKSGTNISGLQGMELSFVPAPSFRPEHLETAEIDEVEVIEIEEEIEAVEVTEIKPKIVPPTVPKFKATEKKLEKKKIAKAVVAPQPEVDSNNNNDSASNQQASIVRGVTSEIGTNNKAQTSYKAIVAAILQKHKRYPTRAVKRRQEGTATITFTIKNDGNVINYELVNSSGYRLLDKAVVAMLQRASPLPPFPNNLKKDKITLVLPVEFYIK